jgi:uncharacterized protein (DUF1697 family)
MENVPFVALLRGINVSGQKLIQMAELRQRLTAAGYIHVQTYIQSGNVYFEAAEQDSKALEAPFERLIMEGYGWDVPTMVRSVAEVEAVVAASPFAAPAGKHEQVYVGFIRDLPDPQLAANLVAMSMDTDRFHIDGKTLYIWQQKGVPKNLLDKINVERLLKTQVTLRNWATTVRLTQW